MNGPLPARWYPLRPHPMQEALWTCPARFIGVSAGRRSGKTELAKRRLVRALAETRFHPRPVYLYGGPTRDQARDVAWRDLLDLIPNCWIAGGKTGPNVRYSNLHITTRFGSTLQVVGLDKPQRIEGRPIDGCILDESCDLKPGVFALSIRPALTDRRGWCWRIGVPKRTGPSAAEFRQFCEDCAAGRYKDGAAFTWPSSDILPEDEVRHVKATLDPKDYREQFEACWETAGGRIFHAFDREYNARPCAYRSDKPILVGSDFNVDPMCWALGHRYEDRMEWFDELFLRDANTQQALDVLAGRYPDHAGGWEFYGDASSQSRATSAAITDYAQIANDKRFKRMGRTIHYPLVNPARADRFACCNAMFCNAAGDRRMFVSPACKRLIDDLENRAYKPGQREPADAGDIGHMTDAMGYVVHRLFPIKIQLSDGAQRVVLT